ncbi:DMT family transporter [Saccharibacillus sacchari]|uniref:DMT family transporter n=1 Tax=Saccharibacillus sacchari TaxID=456493 RepID=UPI0004BC0173|nr:multidrug efflux SMR transporter [Saccharibacillus sacchari]
MKKGYLFLSLAIMFEVFGTTMLKLTEGFTNLIPALFFIIGMGSAFFFLTMTLRHLPLSLAYAIWAGVGTALTAVVGVVLWKEDFSLLSALGLMLIIGGVVFLNFSSGSGKEDTADRASRAIV